MGVAELLFKLLLTTTKNKELFEAAVFLSLSLSLSLFILLMCGGILPVCPIHYVTHPSGKSEA
jgi:hypothetical protein